MNHSSGMMASPSKTMLSFFAVLISFVEMSHRTIEAFHGSRQVFTFAFRVAAAVVIHALVNIFAVRLSVVGPPCCTFRAIEASNSVMATAFFVTAAVVLQALVHIYSRGWSPDVRIANGDHLSRNFKINCTGLHTECPVVITVNLDISIFAQRDV